MKEHAFLVVVDGTARIEAGGETLEAGAGTMVAFDPDERHVVASDSGAKILLMLAPWPGEGHYRGGSGPASSSSSRLPCAAGTSGRGTSPSRS